MKYFRRGVNGRLVETKGRDWDVCEPTRVQMKVWSVPGGVKLEWWRGFDTRKEHPVYMTIPGEGARPIRRSDAARIIVGVRRSLRRMAA